MTDILPPLERVPIAPLPPLEDRARIHAAAETAITLFQLGNPSQALHISVEEEGIARNIFTAQRPPTMQEMEMPGVVMKLSALLDEYDYALIEDAGRIRNYVINRLLEESTDPRHSMRALELLGKISEVSVFTDRQEVLVTHMTQDDMERRLRENLTILLDADDVEVL